VGVIHLELVFTGERRYTVEGGVPASYVPDFIGEFLRYYMNGESRTPVLPLLREDPTIRIEIDLSGDRFVWGHTMQSDYVALSMLNYVMVSRNEDNVRNTGKTKGSAD
jgi:hypothetical protein